MNLTSLDRDKCRRDADFEHKTPKILHIAESRILALESDTIAHCWD